MSELIVKYKKVEYALIVYGYKKGHDKVKQCIAGKKYPLDFKYVYKIARHDNKFFLRLKVESKRPATISS